jgi:hypothetical protein
MFTNNPSVKALHEIRNFHKQAPAYFVSIGTGKKPNKSTPSSRLRWRDFDRAAKIDDVRRKQFIKKYFEIGSRWKQFATDTEGEGGYAAWKDLANEYSMPHARFNVEGEMALIELDDWRPVSSGETTLKLLREATEEYLRQEEQVERIRETARTLVRIRRERARTERWEAFATDVTYECPAMPVCGARKPYKNREEFRNHVRHDAHHDNLKDKEDELEDYLNSGRHYGRSVIGVAHISRVGTGEVPPQ